MATSSTTATPSPSYKVRSTHVTVGVIASLIITASFMLLKAPAVVTTDSALVNAVENATGDLFLSSSSSIADDPNATVAAVGPNQEGGGSGESEETTRQQPSNAAAHSRNSCLGRSCLLILALVPSCHLDPNHADWFNLDFFLKFGYLELGSRTRYFSGADYIFISLTGGGNQSAGSNNKAGKNLSPPSAATEEKPIVITEILPNVRFARVSLTPDPSSSSSRKSAAEQQDEVSPGFTVVIQHLLYPEGWSSRYRRFYLYNVAAHGPLWRMQSNAPIKAMHLWMDVFAAVSRKSETTVQCCAAPPLRQQKRTAINNKKPKTEDGTQKTAVVAPKGVKLGAMGNAKADSQCMRSAFLSLPAAALEWLVVAATAASNSSTGPVAEPPGGNVAAGPSPKGEDDVGSPPPPPTKAASGGGTSKAALVPRSASSVLRQQNFTFDLMEPQENPEASAVFVYHGGPAWPNAFTDEFNEDLWKRTFSSRWFAGFRNVQHPGRQAFSWYIRSCFQHRMLFTSYLQHH